MEQEKIGKFISVLRKEKKMTQMQLAEKLNITDRAVSKWERGKSMPDISIMLELCQILEISVNELLIGEKIEKEEIPKLSDTNLIKALTIVEEKEKKKRKKATIICAILFLILFITLVGIIIYNNAKFILDYNSKLVSCNVEDNALVYKDYRKIAGIPYKIINDDKNNVTYVFFQSIEFLNNYIKNYDDMYELIGYASKSKEDSYNYTKIELDKFFNVNKNKLKVYYTKEHISFNKEYTIKKLNKLLNKATLIFEYN